MTEPKHLKLTENEALEGCETKDSTTLDFENETKIPRAEEKSTETCGKEETERCLYSNLLLILLLVSIMCLGISLRYQWMQVRCAGHGFVSLSLLKMNETFVGFETQETSIIDLVRNDSSGVELKALTVTLVSTVFSGCISFVTLFITSINIWFNSKGCLTGPAAVYLLNFGASLFAVVALAAFLDLYIWSDGLNGIVPPKYYGLFDRDPSNYGPPFVPSLELQLGFYIHLGGVCSSVLGFAFACRLASKLLAVRPVRKGRDPLKDRSSRIAVANRLAFATEGTEMEETQQLTELEPIGNSPADEKTDGKWDDNSLEDLVQFDTTESKFVTTVI